MDCTCGDGGFAFTQKPDSVINEKAGGEGKVVSPKAHFIYSSRCNVPLVSIVPQTQSCVVTSIAYLTVAIASFA